MPFKTGSTVVYDHQSLLIPHKNVRNFLDEFWEGLWILSVKQGILDILIFLCDFLNCTVFVKYISYKFVILLNRMLEIAGKWVKVTGEVSPKSGNHD